MSRRRRCSGGGGTTKGTKGARVPGAENGFGIGTKNGDGRGFERVAC